eukprot:2277312-Prymnesium_polylepis.2
MTFRVASKSDVPDASCAVASPADMTTHPVVAAVVSGRALLAFLRAALTRANNMPTDASIAAFEASVVWLARLCRCGVRGSERASLDYILVPLACSCNFEIV